VFFSFIIFSFWLKSLSFCVLTTIIYCCWQVKVETSFVLIPLRRKRATQYILFFHMCCIQIVCRIKLRLHIGVDLCRIYSADITTTGFGVLEYFFVSFSLHFILFKMLRVKLLDSQFSMWIL